MREIRIDFTAENMLPDGCDIGLIGEHNATDLIITPPSEMAECEEITSYTAAFATEGRIIRSDIYEKAETITVPLCSQLTQDHTLGIQLEGYDGKGELVVKSKLITGLRLLPSAGGDEAEFVSGANGVISQIDANTLARHTHNNASVLDLLGESDGNLTFNGAAVTAGKTKTLEFDLEAYEFSPMPEYNSIQFYIMHVSFENPPIAEGAEIHSVEMKVDIDGIDYSSKWIDIRDMIKYDPYAPYVCQNNRAFYESDSDRTCVAFVTFIHNTNRFFDAANHGGIMKLRVTFSEPKV